MRFSLTIDLGNAAMQTPHDVAYSLRRLASGFDTLYDWPNLVNEGRLKDRNGNTVGTWECS